MRLGDLTVFLALLTPQLASAVSVPTEVEAVSAANQDTSSGNFNHLFKRKGGGGGGARGSSGGRSSSSGKSSSSKSSSSKSSSSKSSSSKSSSSKSKSSSTRYSSNSNNNNRNNNNGGSSGTKNTGATRSFAGGKSYAGGASRPLSPGSNTASGIKPALFAGAAALAFLPAFWFAGAYLYNYNNHFSFRNESSNSDESLPVICGCDPYSKCGCDENDDSTAILKDLVKNGDYNGLNRSVIDVIDVNGTRTLFINGTLPNGTVAPEDESSATRGLSGPADWTGFWAVILIGIAAVYW